MEIYLLIGDLDAQFIVSNVRVETRYCLLLFNAMHSFCLEFHSFSWIFLA